MQVECLACETEVGISVTYELGATWIDPEECPACGEPLDSDVLDRAHPPERDWDQEREREWEKRQIEEEDRQDERIENYPEEGA